MAYEPDILVDYQTVLDSYRCDHCEGNYYHNPYCGHDCTCSSCTCKCDPNRTVNGTHLTVRVLGDRSKPKTCVYTISVYLTSTLKVLESDTMDHFSRAPNIEFSINESMDYSEMKENTDKYLFGFLNNPIQSYSFKGCSSTGSYIACFETLVSTIHTWIPTPSQKENPHMKKKAVRV
jgi:hypothetical protein